MADASDIATYLDKLLRIDEFKDASNNGLQVARRGAVKKVCCGVDASMQFFREAQARGADFLICHHGMSWGDSLKCITGLNYERVSYLVEHNMALYASHLPLDAHPKHGNNAQIAKALGLQELKPFGVYNGKEIGFSGTLPRAQRYMAFKKRVQRALGVDQLQTMDFGPGTIRTVGIVSGGAAGEVEEAGKAGLDAYISGEPGLVAYALAQEYGVNALFGGHYATEVFGVRALAPVVAKRFRVKAEFIDFGIPF